MPEVPQFQIWLLDDDHELQLYRSVDILSAIACGDPGRSIDACRATVDIAQDPTWLNNWSKNWKMAYDLVGRIEISTIYEGCGARPFQTMVFAPGHRSIDEKKYATWHEAMVGHEELVARYRLASESV